MVLYGLNENLRSYKSLKKGANFRLSPALMRIFGGTVQRMEKVTSLKKLAEL